MNVVRAVFSLLWLACLVACGGGSPSSGSAEIQAANIVPQPDGAVLTFSDPSAGGHLEVTEGPLAGVVLSLPPGAFNGVLELRVQADQASILTLAYWRDVFGLESFVPAIKITGNTPLLLPLTLSAPRAIFGNVSSATWDAASLFHQNDEARERPSRIEADLSIGASVSFATQAYGRYFASPDRAPPQVTLTMGSTDKSAPGARRLTLRSDESLYGLANASFRFENAELVGTPVFSAPTTDLEFLVKPKAEGPFSVILSAGSVEDFLGNKVSTDVRAEAVFDATAPVPALVDDKPGPTRLPTKSLRLEWSEDVSDVAGEDFDVTNGAVESIEGSGKTYKILISHQDEGSVTIVFRGGAAKDAFGNLGVASAPASWVYDVTPPALTIGSPKSNWATTPVTFEIAASEETLPLSDSSIVIAGGTLSGITSGRLSLVSVSPTGDGTVTLAVPAHAVQDPAGNDNEAVAFSVVYDATPPALPQDASLSTSSIGPASFAVTWNAATDVTSGEVKYEVRYSIDHLLNSLAAADQHGTIGRDYTETPSANIANLEAQTAYNVAVIARDKAGNRSLYQTKVITTLADVTNPVPGQSGELTASQIKDKSATLTWQAANDDATNSANLIYHLLVSTTDNVDTVESGSNSGVTKTLLGPNKVTTKIEGLSRLTPYFVNVIVTDKSGNKAIYSRATFTTTDDQTPPEVGELSLEAPGSTTMKVKWDLATDDVTVPTAIEYQACAGTTAASVSTVAGCLTAPVKSYWTANITETYLAGLPSGKTHYVGLVARDEKGNMEAFPVRDKKTLPGVAVAQQELRGSFRSTLIRDVRTGVYWFFVQDAGVIRSFFSPNPSLNAAWAPGDVIIADTTELNVSYADFGSHSYALLTFVDDESVKLVRVTLLADGMTHSSPVTVFDGSGVNVAYRTPSVALSAGKILVTATKVESENGSVQMRDSVNELDGDLTVWNTAKTVTSLMHLGHAYSQVAASTNDGVTVTVLQGDVIEHYAQQGESFVARGSGTTYWQALGRSYTGTGVKMLKHGDSYVLQLLRATGNSGNSYPVIEVLNGDRVVYRRVMYESGTVIASDGTYIYIERSACSWNNFRLIRWKPGSADEIISGCYENRLTGALGYQGQLFVAGYFTDFEGVNGADYVARYDGSTWRSLGTGVDAPIDTIAAYQGKVLVGGQLSSAGDITASNHWAAWGGSSWSGVPFAELPGGIAEVAAGETMVYARVRMSEGSSFPLTEYNDLYAWNGSSWTMVATHISYSPLVVDRDFVYFIDKDRKITKADGRLTQAIGDALHSSFGQVALAVFDGRIFLLGSPYAGQGLTEWNGTEMILYHAPLVGQVSAVAKHAGEMYVAGEGLFLGGIYANHCGLMKLSGTQWQSVGDLPGGNDCANQKLTAMAEVAGTLYIGSDRVSSLDGGTLTEVPGISGTVKKLLSFNGQLIAIGDFTNAGGDPDADYIARLDGSQWTHLGSALNGPVADAAVFGTKLYVAGDFTDAGGQVGASYLVRWSGTGEWEGFGAPNPIMNRQFPIAGHILALAEHKGALYVGGDFTEYAGIAAADGIARYSGSAWSALGNGLESSSTRLVSDGSLLYVTSDYFADNLAWSGTAWVKEGHALMREGMRVHPLSDGSVYGSDESGFYQVRSAVAVGVRNASLTSESNGHPVVASETNAGSISVWRSNGSTWTKDSTGTILGSKPVVTTPTTGSSTLSWILGGETRKLLKTNGTWSGSSAKVVDAEFGAEDLQCVAAACVTLRTTPAGTDAMFFPN